MCFENEVVDGLRSKFDASCNNHQKYFLLKLLCWKGSEFFCPTMVTTMVNRLRAYMLCIHIRAVCCNYLTEFGIAQVTCHHKISGCVGRDRLYDNRSTDRLLFHETQTSTSLLALLPTYRTSLLLPRPCLKLVGHCASFPT